MKSCGLFKIDLWSFYLRFLFFFQLQLRTQRFQWPAEKKTARVSCRGRPGPAVKTVPTSEGSGQNRCSCTSKGAGGGASDFCWARQRLPGEESRSGAAAWTCCRDDMSRPASEHLRVLEERRSAPPPRPAGKHKNNVFNGVIFGIYLCWLVEFDWTGSKPDFNSVWQ